MQKLRKQLIEEKLKNAPESVKKLYLGSFDRMNFRDDQDFDEYVSEIDTRLSDLKQDIANTVLKATAGVPASGSVSGASTLSKEYTKSIVDEIMKR